MNIGDFENAENNTDGIHSALPTELHSKLRAAGLEPATSRLSDEVTVNPHQHCFYQKDREYRNRKGKCSCNAAAQFKEMISSHLLKKYPISRFGLIWIRGFALFR